MLDLVPALNLRRLVLASSSPRRIEALRSLGLQIEVVPSRFPEDLEKSSFATPGSYVVENARRKGLEVAERLAPETSRHTLIIAADTVVSLAGEILEKPRDAEDAVRMLGKLSGREHQVFTGLVVLEMMPGKETRQAFVGVEETVVSFAELSEELRRAYVKTKSPLDKAGAYGIQDGYAGSFVRGIRGCYSNVVGLPLYLLASALREVVSSWKD